MKLKLFWLLPLALVLGLASCSEDDDNDQPGPTIVDPRNADALTAVLGIDNSTRVNGSLPAADMGNPDQPTADNNQPSALITSGNTLYLPFTYDTKGKVENFAGVYLQVDGASSYFNVSISGQSSGIMVIPIDIPSNVDTGNFSLSYALYDINGLVSNYLQTLVRIDTNQRCPAFAAGNDGLTIKSVELGSSPGTVTIDYDTYSVPDRVDVFYDGVWQAGTGDPLAPGEIPPASECYDGTNGYVGERGTFEFEYDGTGSGRLDVYMSGCLGGGTAWILDVSCPE